MENAENQQKQTSVMKQETFNFLKNEINQEGVGGIIVRKYLFNKAISKGIIPRNEVRKNGTSYNMNNAIFKMVQKGVLIKNTPGTYLVVREIPNNTWKDLVRQIKEESNTVSSVVAKDPLDIQIGGSHYTSMVVQPIELITKMNLSFIQGNIVKYICRYPRKNGMQDVEKCGHYAHLAIEFKERRVFTSRYCLLVNDFVSKNNLNEFQKEVLDCVVKSQWRKIFELTQRFVSENLDVTNKSATFAE